MAQSATSTRNATDELADKAANLAEKTGEQIERFSQQGRQASEQVQQVADNFKQAVDKSVQDQPLTTLAIAAGIGFVIGALWKS